MRIALGSQKSGFPLKEAVRIALQEAGHEVVDLGQKSAEEDFPFLQMIRNVTDAVRDGECERGIVICGSGAGASLAAGKVKGIYCMACESVFMAERVVPFNNVNVMAMGAYTVSHRQGAEMAVKFAQGKWGDGFTPEQMEGLKQVFAEIQLLESESA